MAQTHLERLRELRQWQAERDRELARRCPVPPERSAQADPGRREQARAPMVRCKDCYYFDPWKPGDRGDCVATEPSSWPMLAATWRSCPLFLADPLGIAVQVLADRWQYSEQELASALKCAAVDPSGWWRVIDADLEARLWPAPSGRS